MRWCNLPRPHTSHVHNHLRSQSLCQRWWPVLFMHGLARTTENGSMPWLCVRSCLWSWFTVGPYWCRCHKALLIFFCVQRWTSMNGHGNRIICVEVLQSSPCGAVEGDDGEMQPPVYSHDLFRCHCVSVNLPFDPLENRNERIRTFGVARLIGMV